MTMSMPANPVPPAECAPAGPATTGPIHPKYRPDIDGLRAVAVSAVVVYHAAGALLPGGFVGVDIFFVISGFLISTIIFDSLDADRFSLLEFYRRRVVRIFPGLALVLACCGVAGWLVLLPGELAQLGRHMAAGAASVENFALWSEAGYFDARSELKPLLHLWSLGVEEQYYLVWPLLCALTWRKPVARAVTLPLLGILSFVLAIHSVQADPTAAFYSPFTRFWELLVGSLLALHHRQVALPATALRVGAHAMSLAGLAAVVAAFVLIDSQTPFPGAWALLPTAGAALLIGSGPDSLVNRRLLARPAMVFLGLISYPLYLWHWPLLAFLRIVTNGAATRGARAAAVALAVVLAWLTYRFVERWARAPQRRSAKVCGLLAAVAVSGGAGWALHVDAGAPRRPLALAARPIDAAVADHASVEPVVVGDKVVGAPVFAGRSAERVLFLGDSTMTQYFTRLSAAYATSPLPLYTSEFAAKPGCRPIAHGAGINSPGKHCDEYYRAAMALAGDPSVRRVVIAANWESVFGLEARADNRATLEADLRALRLAGKEIVLVTAQPHSPMLDPLDLARDLRLHPLAPPPLPGERRVARSAVEGPDVLMARRGVAGLGVRLGATLVDPFDFLCNNDDCLVIAGGHPLYSDAYHLTTATARQRAAFVDSAVGK